MRVRARVAVAVSAAALGLVWLLVAAESGAAQEREDKALNRPATASSVEDQRGGTCAFRVCVPGRANDGNGATRWGSAFTDNQFWQVDLGRARLVDTVYADWQFAYPASYQVSTSLDGRSFTTVGSGSLPVGLDADHVPVTTSFAARSARYVRLTGIRRATQYGFSLWTVNVYGPSDTAAAAPPPVAGPPTAAPAPGPAAAGSPAPAPDASAPTPAATAPALRPIAKSTRVRLAGRVAGARTRIQLLAVRAPRKATVRVRCRGGGCPAKVRARRGSGTIAKLHQRLLLAGSVLEVFVTQPQTYGKYTRFEFRSGAAPSRTDRCVAAGTRTPIDCPAV